MRTKRGKVIKSAYWNLVEGTSALLLTDDLETEFAKDRWDARKIPGLRYAPHRTNYYINFGCIPEAFRPAVKDYAKFQFAADRAAKTLDQCAYYLGRFFTFFVEHYPCATTLHDLKQQDIDDFIVYLKAKVNNRGQLTSDTQIGYHVLALEGFLCYLERGQNPIRPEKPTPSIIWPHHYPNWKSDRRERVKYIPESVLKQIDTHLHQIYSTYIPIVILLRASGWRISDVLYLKWDTCLEQGNEKFSLVGDIQIMWNTFVLIFYRFLRTFSRGITVFSPRFSVSN
jgi:hypothetical protein